MDKEQHIRNLFEQAQQEPLAYSFEEVKAQFLTASSAVTTKTAKPSRLTKNGKMMISTVSIIGVAIGMFVLINNNKSSESKASQERVFKKNEVEMRVESEQPEVAHCNQIGTRKSQQMPQSKSPTILALEEKNELFQEAPIVYFREDSKKIDQVLPIFDENPYEVPKLTEEEILITSKKKKAMLKALQKVDKNSYSFSNSGSFDYHGKVVSCQAFFISQTEVTNFEYRTFLFDLLIQGRNDEFLKAKPDQNQWTLFEDGRLSSFKDAYFSDKTFNEYPVVNISREGAELYCKWFTEELQKLTGDKQGELVNQVRLPLRVEWIKAASADGKNTPYPWGGPYVRNSKGFVLANHVLDRGEVERFSLDTTKMDVLAPAKSYWPTTGNMYNLSGNVAEMVYENSDKSFPGTAGGSWRNSQEEIKIYGKDPFQGVTDPKPTIGFRIVMTFIKK